MKKNYFNNLHLISTKNKFLKMTFLLKSASKSILIFLFLIFSSIPLKAQETGPLLMKQELGYTLGGSVLGAGLGVIVWFMDPLNPSITLKSTVQNGFVAGTALGALFGFYMLQNAIVIPEDTTIPDNLDQLLGIKDFSHQIHKSIIIKKNFNSYKNINFKILNFRF
tara:strand:+ start:121 stop:618 length:498 start_codon:yes stop_codon:yes gene_type:complete